MATMYPNQISPATQSEAERRLYAAFRDQLDPDFFVFHSVAWQALDREGRPRDGEADFIIAHPQLGVLVLEVKGGAIRHDPRAGRWESVDRGGRPHAIHNPFLQARKSMYTLLDQLKTAPRLASRQINIGHAVAFPDVVVGDEILGMDRPRAIVLDATDLANCTAWVRRTLDYWRGPASRRDTAPGQAAVESLIGLLGKSWELRPALWGDFAGEQQQILRLTEQQFVVLDGLNRSRRQTICGCAGSGKTMLAVEKATRLARTPGFQRVLLTCYNRSLAHDLQMKLGTVPNLDVVHFHELAGQLAKAAGIALQWRDDEAYYTSDLPEAMFQALDVVPTRYDAVVVDEGQDFHELWWLPLEKLLRHKDESIFYIFYDDNQRIYDRPISLPIDREPYVLTVNCRNTQAIHRQVVKFYRGDVMPRALGPEGRPVEIVTYPTAEQLPTTLMDLLRRLALDERIPTEQIIVLTPLSGGAQRLGMSLPNSRLKLVDQPSTTPGHIYCTTIHSFKGLERAVVVLAELHRWPSNLGAFEPAYYVACSRACNHLIVLLPEDRAAKTRALFA